MTLCLVAIFLCGLALGLRRLLRRQNTDCNELRVLSRAGLTQRSGLALVSISGRRLLIGYGEGAPSLLFDQDASVLPDAAEQDDDRSPSAERPSSKGFSHRQDRLAQQRRKKVPGSAPSATPPPRSTDAATLSRKSMTRDLEPVPAFVFGLGLETNEPDAATLSRKSMTRDLEPVPAFAFGLGLETNEPDAAARSSKFVNRDLEPA